MKTLDYIVGKYSLNIDTKWMPVEIPGTTRGDLARLFAELGFKVGVEVGVETGLYTKVLCRENPQAKIYGVDAWAHYGNYRDHVSQEKSDTLFAEAQERMGKYPNCELVHAFSMDAVKDVEDIALDFVYIDANHDFQYVVNDICEWSKKVRPGGIVSGHDYRKVKPENPSIIHVVEAVQGYTQAYRIRPWFVLGKKINDEIRESARSWLWVKQ